MNEKILNKILEMSEQFFGTVHDPEQIPITKESLYKLQKLHPKAFVYILENGEPASWTVALPTSNELADKFLKKEISEKDLLNMTKSRKQYEAIYLCSAFTIPEHRGKGYAIKMLKKQINSIPHIADVKLFAWIYSQEGECLTERLEQELRVKIHRR